MAMRKNQDYYLGLDIGTDSVGYAATNPDYSLLKYRGEPMWGAMTFDEGSNAAERRGYRIARRRLDRRKQRLQLLQELFAVEIGKIDPNFFIRRKESILFPEDSSCGVQIFQGGGITDKDYHRRYPTIHHLILDLMSDSQPHDIRLVYLACSWLIAHRGHFLFDIDPKNTDRLLNFSEIYRSELCVFLDNHEFPHPWPDTIDPKRISEIMCMQAGVAGKKAAFKEQVYEGKAIPKGKAEESWYAIDQAIALLSGGKVKLAALFPDLESEESICLSGDDETFAQTISALDEDQAEFLSCLRKLADCARLTATMTASDGKQYSCISAAKIAVYDRHKADLEYLKGFLRTYHPEKFSEVFRQIREDNYVTYSKHILSVKKKDRPAKFKWSTKDKFSDSLKKIVKDTPVSDEDRPAYEDMLFRLDQRTFLPKQRDSDNRIIPQQLYRMELDQILRNAEGYLPLLRQCDADGLTVKEKILSIFSFHIPYYVGPLNRSSGNAWFQRKADGKILPWNLEKIVDLDASEDAFIRRMTNQCTYLPGEDVLPEKSLLYGRFTVLNELNNLKVNGCPIPVDVKQLLFTQVFCRYKRVTPKKLKECLISNGLVEKDAELSGIDETIHANLSAYHIFRNLLESKQLTEGQVEEIISRCAYSEDKGRLLRWLRENYALSEGDCRYISCQNLKGFGRLSRRFLTQLQGGLVSDGERKSILEWMWDTNENLMQLLSDRYTFSQTIQAESLAYYAKPEHQKTLAQRLKDEHLPGSVRRAIHRTLDIVQDVANAAGAPKKIFVEMARGGTPDQKGKRTRSRKNQLLDIYSSIKTQESRQLQKQIEDMGEMADNRLQSDALFLYFLQMGKSAYTGRPIDLAKLGTDTYYNKDHIYPQSLTKDDSVLNNLVLVESTINDRKKAIYPVAREIRESQKDFWEILRKNGLMSEEKFRRLTRATQLTDAEKMGFINRQLVETRQSTKVIAQLLQEKFPHSEIVYVKAGLVSEFRQEYKIVKCRSVNDLHHAKDAYLNIVVGNVYHERFNKRWFRLTDDYNVELKKIMKYPLAHGEEVIWRGEADIAKVKKIAEKNAVHLTRYAFKRTSISNANKHAGLFNQQLEKANSGLVPRKKYLNRSEISSTRKELPPEKYGGYNSATISYFVLVRFQLQNRQDIMIVPVELYLAERFEHDFDFAIKYVTAAISEAKSKKEVKSIQFLLNGRKLKINTVFSFDGCRMYLAGKSGKDLLFAPATPLIVGSDAESYIKKLQVFQEKQHINPGIQLDENFDGISKSKNLLLYNIFAKKLNSAPFRYYPLNPYSVIDAGRAAFQNLPVNEQIDSLLKILNLFRKEGSGGVDLTAIGGKGRSAAKVKSATVSNWGKINTDIRIIDSSPAGLSEIRSGNLLDLL